MRGWRFALAMLGAVTLVAFANGVIYLLALWLLGPRYADWFDSVASEWIAVVAIWWFLRGEL